MKTNQLAQAMGLLASRTICLLIPLLAATGPALAARGAEVSPTTPQLSNAAPPPPVDLVKTTADEPEWQTLFDGGTLTGWGITDFAGHGEVKVVRAFKSEKAKPGERGAPAIVMYVGAMLTGINWTNDVLKMDYEISLEAMRVDGSDFFCGLTFPVKDSHCSFIVGGWGGGVVGISSLNDYDASENDTTKFMAFEAGRWYLIRVRVTAQKLEAWIDQEKLVNVDTRDRRISLRPGDIELSKPLGIAAYQTTAAVREIKWRRLPAKATPAPQPPAKP